MIHSRFQEQILPITPAEAWEFFSAPRNLDAITPPNLGFRIVCCPTERIHEGLIIEYRIKIVPGLWVPWVTEIRGVEEGRAFIDEQRFGPYKFWHHRHTFEAVEGGVKLTDRIHYALPFGPLGSIAHALFVRRKMEEIFRFRREELERRFPRRS
jgi:ligand-binding SRPBCC domain-containing protein